MIPVVEISSNVTKSPYNTHGYKRWLPIKQKWDVVESCYLDSEMIRLTLGFDRQDTMTTLRSLSNTCRKLRALALPALWSAVDVSTIDELGRLRETLRVNPSIALLIRQFPFMWSSSNHHFNNHLRNGWEPTTRDTFQASFSTQGSGPDGGLSHPREVLDR